MTQRRRTSKKAKAKRRFGRRAFLTGAGVAACGLAGGIRGKRQRRKTAASGQDVFPRHSNSAPPAGEWRAVWV